MRMKSVAIPSLVRKQFSQQEYSGSFKIKELEYFAFDIFFHKSFLILNFFWLFFLQLFTDSKYKMSRVLSVVVGLICAVLAVNVHCENDYSILSPDGSYNPGK